MTYKIAVFPGDGVGHELIGESIKVIEKVAELDNFNIEWIMYPYGAEHYAETKELLTEKTLREIKNSCNVIFCGTFDSIKAEDIFIEKNIPNLIKSYFDQFVNLRPIKLLPSIEGVLTDKTYNDIDFTLIRENTEDFYVGISGRAKNGKYKNQLEINKGVIKAKIGLDIESKGNELAYQIGFLSKKGCERFIKYAFNYTKNNNKKNIVAVDKANVLDSYNLWREIFAKVSNDYSEIAYEFHLIDAVVMNLLRQPEKYQVIVAPNLFGDILSDLGTSMQGGLAFGARGNINPDGISMFEPIHGCAPKLRNQGIVNPIATIWAGALMLENIAQKKSSDLILKSIETVLKDGRTRTQDLGGNNTTSEMADAIVDKLIELHD